MSVTDIHTLRQTSIVCDSRRFSMTDTDFCVAPPHSATSSCHLITPPHTGVSTAPPQIPRSVFHRGSSDVDTISIMTTVPEERKDLKGSDDYIHITTTRGLVPGKTQHRWHPHKLNEMGGRICIRNKNVHSLPSNQRGCLLYLEDPPIVAVALKIVESKACVKQMWPVQNKKPEPQLVDVSKRPGYHLQQVWGPMLPHTRFNQKEMANDRLTRKMDSGKLQHVLPALSQHGKVKMHPGGPDVIHVGGKIPSDMLEQLKPTTITDNVHDLPLTKQSKVRTLYLCPKDNVIS